MPIILISVFSSHYFNHILTIYHLITKYFRQNHYNNIIIVSEIDYDGWTNMKVLIKIILRLALLGVDQIWLDITKLVIPICKAISK